MEKKLRILWIEDDYHAIRGLMLPLEKLGGEIDIAQSAMEGYHKSQDCTAYDLIVVDMIMPLTIADEDIPGEVKAWDREKYTGIGFVKWFKEALNSECKLTILSIVKDPIRTFGLEKYSNLHYISKRGLSPTELKERILEIIGQ